MSKENINNGLLPVDYDPFSGPEILRVVPTIEPQLEIWVSCIMGGEDANRAYNESVSLRLKGPFDQPSMQHALRDLVGRHEALRSSFSADGKQIFIYKEWPVSIFYDDISAQTPEQQRSYITEFSKNDANSSFDLLNGPLVRFAILKIAENEHQLKITAHHIVCDGWSLGVLLQDVSKLYSAYVKGETPNLPEAFKFSQYAIEFSGFLQTEDFKKNEQYWIDKYKDVPVLNIPTDFPRPAIRTYKSNRFDYALDRELVSEVKKTGMKAGCSLVTTMLSAFEIFLYRLTGQNDIVLGLPAAGQSLSSNYSSLVGHCVNLLPLRSKANGELSFLEHLKQQKSNILDDYDHQQISFGRLVKDLKIARDPSRIPLIPVTFNIDIGLDNGVCFEKLEHTTFYDPREYESFEIFLNAMGSEQSLVLEWSYNTQLFRPATIARMMEEFEYLLRSVAGDPLQKINDIPFVRMPEKNNAGVQKIPKFKSIVAYFIEQVEKRPDHVALVFKDEKLTYRELNEKSNQLAHFLIKKGIQKESLVPICIKRSAEMIIGILGILKAGGAYVPIDPEYPADRISFMLEDCNAQLILSSNACYRKIPSAGNLQFILLDEWHEIKNEPVGLPQVIIDERQLAYIIYTSGSTGRPKGSMIENRNVVSLVKYADYVKLSADNILLSTGSFSFDATTFEFWGMLLNGGQLVLCTEETLLNNKLLAEEISNRKVNIAWFTSSLLNQWIDLDIHIFKGLKTILAGGEKLSEKHIAKLRKQYPSLIIINGYGPTENTTFSLTYPIGEIDPAGTVIPIGKPLNNRTAYVLNEQLHLCAVGVVGELYLGGAGVGRGYLNRPDLTNERFVKDIFSTEPHAKMYRTGDMARLMDDGNVEYIGRMDDQVKIRGFRVELGEIENTLQHHSSVKQCAVIVKENPEGDKQLVAYIVPQKILDKNGLLNFLQSKLPVYMIPRVLIEIDKMPLTNNGKTDRHALLNIGQKIDHDKRKNSLPETEGQQLIANIWAKALGLEQVDIDDDFFELGGHSLIAIQVMKRLEEETGLLLPITSLFEAPTVRKLSLMLNLDKKLISWKTLVPIKPGGTKPPLYIVHGSGLTVMIFNSLAKGLDPDQPVYGLQSHGLNGEEPFDTIEELASYYISEIMKQNPTGPYCLAGYSFGGIVAFEMAKQFVAAGKEIKTLAIFDTNADNTDNFLRWAVRMRRKAVRQFPKMLFISKSLLKHPAETLKYQFRFFHTKFRSFFEWIGLLEESPTEEEKLSVFAKKINEKHYRAMRNYKMTEYNGIVDLFKVQERLYYLDDPEYLGWKPYALKGVRLHDIPGDHKTFLIPPNDKELAKILSATLNGHLSVKEVRKEYLMSTA